MYHGKNKNIHAYTEILKIIQEYLACSKKTSVQYSTKKASKQIKKPEARGIYTAQSLSRLGTLPSRSSLTLNQNCEQKSLFFITQPSCGTVLSAIENILKMLLCVKILLKFSFKILNYVFAISNSELHGIYIEAVKIQQ